MEDQSIWYLQNVNLEKMLCPNKLGQSASANSHEEKAYKKGEFIYMPEDDAAKIYFISEGRVKISSLSNEGKEMTKAILTEGELFGELGLVGEAKRKDSAQAMEKTMLCAVTVDQMKMLMKDHSNLSLFFMKLIGSRILDMEKRLESMVFKDSRTRIIEYVLELVDKKGQRVGYEFVVRNFLTHQEIANITATSRQTVTTILNELKNKEILTFNRKRLLVRDLEKLKEEIVVHV